MSTLPQNFEKTPQRNNSTTTVIRRLYSWGQNHMAPPGGATSKRQAWLYGARCHHTENSMNKTFDVQTSANRWQKMRKSSPKLVLKKWKPKASKSDEYDWSVNVIVQHYSSKCGTHRFSSSVELKADYFVRKGTNYERTLLFPLKYERRRGHLRRIARVTSLGKIVTRFPWIAKRLTSSNTEVK